MFLCTEVSYEDDGTVVGIVDTDDFKCEMLPLRVVKEFMKNNLYSVTGLPELAKGSDIGITRAIMQYLKSVDGFVELNNLIIVTSDIDLTKNVPVKELQIWFEGYYYKLEFIRDNIYDMLTINEKAFFESVFLTGLRQLSICENGNLRVGFSSPFRAEFGIYTYIELTKEGEVLYEGKRFRGFNGKPMSKAVFKRIVFQGGIQDAHLH